ncbi:MAG: hypothetical protein ACW981_07250 [Candidatus Hodarchaeales archaeon]|jgi:hypothetical protein
MQFDHELVEMPRFSRNEYLYAIIKGIVFLGFFAVVHQIYRWTPEAFQPLAALISEVNESLFQHFKMGFVIWIMLLILELLIFRNRITDKNTFIYSRLTTTFILAWITFTMWTILPGLTQNFEPTVEVEILWSFLATFMTGFIGAIFDSIFLRIKFNRETKLLILIVLVISYLQFLAFSFNIPPDWLFFEGPVHLH